MKNKKSISFELIDVIGELSEEKNGWQKLLTKVSWNDEYPTLEIRNYKVDTIYTDEVRMSKGITLSEEELCSLGKILLENGYAGTYKDLEKHINKSKVFTTKIVEKVFNANRV